MLQCDFPDKSGSRIKRRPMARLPAAGILVERSIALFWKINIRIGEFATRGGIRQREHLPTTRE
jgi:hypothetical protein